MATPTNSRAVIGSNTPDAIDYAKEESARLQRDYAELENTAVALEEEASTIEVITDPAGKEVVVNLIKRIRDVKTRIEALHGLEKQPHLRRGQGVDQFFFGVWDRLMKRDKKNRDGIADVLGKILTDYDVRVLAEENERRRKAAEEAARAEAIRLEAQRKAEAAAEEARLKAERARTEATTAAKAELARQAEEEAAKARVEATVATAKAEEAHIETLARPADIMRTRTSAGTLSTMQQETFAEITDQASLDVGSLWPYIPFDAKQKALNAWARSTDFNQPMPGAKVGRRPKSTVR
jgi:hypothetical protein